MPFQKGNKEATKRGKNKKTLRKELELEKLQQEILKEIKPLLRAALNSATGLTVMYQRKKVRVGKEYKREGELVKVTDQFRVEQLLRGNQQGDDWYYITTKDPNVQALENLFNRVFGKPQDFGKPLGDKDNPLVIQISQEIADKNDITPKSGNNSEGQT